MRIARRSSPRSRALLARWSPGADFAKGSRFVSVVACTGAPPATSSSGSPEASAACTASQESARPQDVRPGPPVPRTSRSTGSPSTTLPEAWSLSWTARPVRPRGPARCRSVRSTEDELGRSLQRSRPRCGALPPLRPCAHAASALPARPRLCLVWSSSLSSLPKTMVALAVAMMGVVGPDCWPGERRRDRAVPTHGRERPVQRRSAQR